MATWPLSIALSILAGLLFIVGFQALIGGGVLRGVVTVLGAVAVLAYARERLTLALSRRGHQPDERPSY